MMTTTTNNDNIRCDDCRKWVPQEEVWVWLTESAVTQWMDLEPEYDPVYMCEQCTQVFLDDNKEFPEFKKMLKRVEDAKRGYETALLERLR